MTRQFEQYSAYTPMPTTTTVSTMTDNRTTELLQELLEERGVSCQTNYLHASWHVGPKLYEAVDNLDGTLTVDNLTPEQAIAATLGWIEEPDTIRNELTDSGLIADVVAPVCVDERERMAFERGRVHERFAQQIFKGATS